MRPDVPDRAARLLDADMLKYVDFILEVDKLKLIKRRSPLLDISRTETDAEHSWHVALIALLLSQRAPPGVNSDRVIKMMLIHDIVEIDAGDTFLYDLKAGADQSDREQKAATRIFGLLPRSEAAALIELWEEFEADESPDARFARGIDRLQPLLLNYFSGGGTWNMPGVSRDEVLRRKQPIAEIHPDLWAFGQALIEDGVSRGWLRADAKFSPKASSKVQTISIREHLDICLSSNASDEIMQIVEDFERRFKRPLSTLIRFSEEILLKMHLPFGPDEVEFGGATFALSIASAYDETVINEITTMGRIANTGELCQADSVKFFEVVLSIYRKLLGGLAFLAVQDDTFCIAPEREGRLIAEALGLLQEGRSSRPNAKRISHGADLIVGLEVIPIPDSFKRCVIIDGAIASGATLIALIESVRGSLEEFHVFSAHATASSLRALSRYAAEAGIRLSVNVGHVSGALNKKRYAIHDDKSLVVGDLGDLISPVFM